MLIDTSAAARRADPERVREWLAEQRVFISSAMADTARERDAAAAVVEEEGGRAVRFEEFGRDADAEEAYLAEVDASTIYVAILNEVYGRLNPPGYSATEAEYLRAREGGKRIFVVAAADAPGREGHLTRFLERVRFYTTTENYRDVDDLARRLRRRLHELAAEALSPWVKLGELVFRADEVDDAGDTVRIRVRVSDEIANRLETLRDQRFGRQRLRFVHRSRVVEGELAGVRRTTRASGADELVVELRQARRAEGSGLRAGTSGLSAEELVELAMRSILFGEPLPDQAAMLGLAETGIDVDDLRQAFDQPNEIAEAITRLVIADGLVGSGRARRLISLSVGPRSGDVRRVVIEWEDPRVYTNVEPARRRLEGPWRRP
jgi:hypothetical protein